MSDTLPLHLLTARSCRMARAGLGIIQKELAKSSGVHVRTVKMLETGQAQPMSKTALGVMRALVDRGVVFGYDGSIRIDGAEPQPEPSALSPIVRPTQLHRVDGAEGRHA